MKFKIPFIFFSWKSLFETEDLCRTAECLIREEIQEGERWETLRVDE